MQYLKQSTAATVIMGPFVDKGDGVTPEVGLAAGTVDEIGIYKHDGVALTDISGTTTFTHRAGGMYTMTLSTTDTNTLGRMTAFVRDDSVCLPVWKDFMVMPANVWDSLCGADMLKVDVHAIDDDETAANNAELAFDGTGFGFTGCTMPTTTAVTNRVTANTDQIEGGDATDALDTACTTALQGYNLDHLLSSACPGNVITGAVVDHSVVACLAAVGHDISDYSATTDSQEAIGTDLDQSLSTTESNIRGADSDDLKTISDQLDAITVDNIWDEEMDANAPAACDTAREYMNMIVAALAGKTAGTGDWSARDLGDTKTRLQATLTAAGARSSVDTLDGT